MAFAPQPASPKTPTPSQPKSSGFNEWIRTRPKWFWISTIAVVWIIGIAIRAAQPPTNTDPANLDAGRRAERILKSKGWDDKLSKPDASKASSPEQPSQSSDQ